jgi:hypothetical protein
VAAPTNTLSLLLRTYVQLWVLFGVIDMVKAALSRDPTGRSPGRVFHDMFKCWRNAFEDFVPGVKAEWKQVFNNRVRDCNAAASVSVKPSHQVCIVFVIVAMQGSPLLCRASCCHAGLTAALQG